MNISTNSVALRPLHLYRPVPLRPPVLDLFEPPDELVRFLIRPPAVLPGKAPGTTGSRALQIDAKG